jgi:hypothetical protein
LLLSCVDEYGIGTFCFPDRSEKRYDETKNQ